MPHPRPTVTIFRAGGAESSQAGAGVLQRQLHIAGAVLLVLLALGLTLLIVVPLALLTLIAGAGWLIYAKLAGALSSLRGATSRAGRRNVRVIER